MASSATKQYKKFKWSKWSDLYKLSDYVVLDTETTGLSPEKERIIEVAAIRVKDGAVVDQFVSLTNPGKPLSSRITRLTGITDEDLSSAPKFPEIADQIVQFIGHSTVLAHNAPFDMSFLYAELAQSGIHADFVWLDTLPVAKRAFPDFKNHKLETLISELNLSDKQTHRALDDALCTFKMFDGVCKQYGSPLGDAISSCCTPISDYRIKFTDSPLDGLRIALIGAFTFSYAAAKKLISVAGGKVVNAYDADADYLVYGYIDPIEGSLDHEQRIEEVKFLHQNGGKTKPINEVAFLGLCGVSFYDSISSESTSLSEEEEEENENG